MFTGGFAGEGIYLEEGHVVGSVVALGAALDSTGLLGNVVLEMGVHVPAKLLGGSLGDVKLLLRNKRTLGKLSL